MYKTTYEYFPKWKSYSWICTPDIYIIYIIFVVINIKLELISIGLAAFQGILLWMLIISGSSRIIVNRPGRIAWFSNVNVFNIVFKFNLGKKTSRAIFRIDGLKHVVLFLY